MTFTVIFYPAIYFFFSLCLYHVACGTSVSQTGFEPVHPALEGRVLTTGPPGKYLSGHLSKTLLVDVLSMAVPRGILGMRETLVSFL